MLIVEEEQEEPEKKETNKLCMNNEHVHPTMFLGNKIRSNIMSP